MLKHFRFGVWVKFYLNLIIIEILDLKEGGGRGRFYLRYPTKVYNSTTLSVQVKSYEIRATFYWKSFVIKNFRLLGEGTQQSCTIKQYYQLMSGIRPKFYWKFKVSIEIYRDFKAKDNPFVIGTTRKFTIRHYYLLKSFMLEVRVNFYWNPIRS